MRKPILSIRREELPIQMPPKRAKEIYQYLAQQSDVDIEIDLSTLLEDFLDSMGIREIREHDLRKLNFSEIALVLYKSGEIYGKQVDDLFVRAQELLWRTDKWEEENDDREAEGEAAEGGRKKNKKSTEFTNFKRIELDEAPNITMRSDAVTKTAPVLPRAFIQFEPRIISENDIQLRDHAGELIGLMNDFRVNWNMSDDFTLCDDVDFSSFKKSSSAPANNSAENAIMSPSDSGHMSDGFTEPFDALNSPDSSNCRVTPVLTPETATVVRKVSKRKVPDDQPKGQSKFYITSPLAGTAKCLNLSVSDFSPSFPKKIMKQKDFHVQINKFIGDVYTEDAEKTFVIKPLLNFKKRHSVTWSRTEAQKKLKLSKIFFNDCEEVLGFSDDEELDESLQNLNEAFDRLSSNNAREHDASDDDDNFLVDNEIENRTDDQPPPCSAVSNNENLTDCGLAEQSELSKKIEAWHASIQKKLESIEERKEMDLKLYSEHLLNIVRNNTSKTSKFSRIIEKRPPEDVARYFLTTLILANKNKVLIKQPAPFSCGDFEIALQDGSSLQDEEFDSTFSW